MQDWAQKQFSPDFDHQMLGMSAQKYHYIINKYDVTLREALMLWFCTAHMNSDHLEIGVEEFYECSEDEARSIVEACNWGKPGSPSIRGI